jgi:hypothetical protein
MSGNEMESIQPQRIETIIRQGKGRMDTITDWHALDPVRQVWTFGKTGDRKQGTGTNKCGK